MLERTAPTRYIVPTSLHVALSKDSKLSLTSLPFVPVANSYSPSSLQDSCDTYLSVASNVSSVASSVSPVASNDSSVASSLRPLVPPESSTLRSSDLPPPSLGSRPPDDSLPGPAPLSRATPALLQSEVRDTYLVSPAPASRPIPTSHSPGRFAAHVQHPSHSLCTRIHSLFSTHASFTRSHALKHFPHLGP